MATSGEDNVDVTVESNIEEGYKDADKPTVEAEQQNDDVTPTATSEATGETGAGDAETKTEDAADDEPKSKRSKSRSKSLTADPELVIEHIRVMQAGCEMMKVKGNKQYHRTFWLDEELTNISWNSASKKPFKARILLSSVKEARRGANTEGFKSSGKTFEDEKCFSIIFGSDFKSLDLLCQNASEAEIWINGIRALKHHTDSASRQSQARDRYIKGLFEEADKNNDGTLDFSEIIKLMKLLNVGLSKRVLKKKFKEVDDDLNGTLNFDEFSNLFRELATRPELWNLFIKHTSQPDFMSVSDLQAFLEVQQRSSPVSYEDCEELIELYECSTEGKAAKLLSFDGFTAFMFGKENDIFNFNHKAIFQDMTQPLSHYYIHSSHNTYLLGDQLRSESSVEAYIRALRAGCRCVELDCWDGDNNDPIIYHGHTLTSKILFKDVIAAIRDHAFAKSPYPVILSIENHCSIEQQNIMADYMQDILGEMLYMSPVDDGKEYLPSPEDLVQKVLIKGKKLPKELEDNDDSDGGDVSDEDEAGDIDPRDIEVAREKAESGETPGATAQVSPQQGKFRRTFSFRRRERQDSGSGSAAANTPVKEQAPKKKIKLGRKLSKTVNNIQSVSFKGFSHTFSAGKFNHMSSFGEQGAFKLKGNSGVDFVQYNKRQISRIYPAGKRIDSSNYDPVDMWNSGCQIVALNSQTPGSRMDYNLGKFQQNGGCGYILKPSVMRSEVSLFDPNSREPVPGIVSKTFTIKVISGQHLPKPFGGSKTGEIIDPYVKIELRGLACDNKEFKTKYISDNGFNPVWNETITFTVLFPELCLLRFSIYDSDTLSDDFIGQYTLPLESVERGYRHVHLHTPTWEKIEHATIFVHVTIHDAHHFNMKKLISNKATIEKARRGRKYPEPRYISVPDVDKIFRSSTYLMRESRDLKEDYHFYLLKFKGLVDAKAEASLRESVWLMGFKSKNAKIELILKKKGKIFEVDAKTAHVPNSIAHMFTTFNELNNATVPILDRADDIHSQLTQIFEQAFKKRKDIHDVLSHYGMNAKKIAKGVENYSWTMQIIQSEMIHVSKLKEVALKNLDQIMDAATRVNLEIVEEKVPTIEEAKSLEAIIDVPKTSTNDDKDKDEAGDTTTSAKESDDLVTEVVAAIQLEVVESQPALEETELKVTEASKESERVEQTITVEVDVDKSEIDQQVEISTEPESTEPIKEAEPEPELIAVTKSEDSAEQKDEPQGTSDEQTVEDVPKEEEPTTATDEDKEEPTDTGVDLSQGIVLTVSTDEAQPEVTVQVNTDELHPEATVQVESSPAEEKSSSPPPEADKPPADDKRPDSRASSHSSSSSSSSSSSHSKHEETPDKDENETSPTPEAAADGDSGED